MGTSHKESGDHGRLVLMTGLPLLRIKIDAHFDILLRIRQFIRKDPARFKGDESEKKFSLMEKTTDENGKAINKVMGLELDRKSTKTLIITTLRL